jgi:hypothetical protein
MKPHHLQLLLPSTDATLATPDVHVCIQLVPKRSGDGDRLLRILLTIAERVEREQVARRVSREPTERAA